MVRSPWVLSGQLLCVCNVPSRRKCVFSGTIHARISTSSTRFGPLSFFTHAGNASVGQRWETPTELLEALYRVFKRFDLDPCAPRKSRTRVKARVHLTEEDDGLALTGSIEGRRDLGHA